MILKNFTLYDLKYDNSPIEFANGTEVLEYYADHCTCAKNPIKIPINKRTPMFGESVCLSSYSNCPVNAIGAMLGRHGNTMLSYDPKVLDHFGSWVKQGQYIETIVAQIK